MINETHSIESFMRYYTKLSIPFRSMIYAFANTNRPQAKVKQAPPSTGGVVKPHLTASNYGYQITIEGNSQHFTLEPLTNFVFCPRNT